MATHAIGKGTVNRTANLTRELDLRLGRVAGYLNKSKSELIREWVAEKVNEISHNSLIGLFLLAVTLAGICQLSPQYRRAPRGRRRDESAMVLAIKGGEA